MAAWMWPAAGAAAGIASSFFGGGNQKQRTKMPAALRETQHYLINPKMGGIDPNIAQNIWSLPEVGYGPTRVYQGPTPEVQQAYGSVLDRVGGSPYEAAAGDYATQAITGQNLYSNPALGFLGGYGAGYGGFNPWAGPGRQLMMGTAAGSGYNNPYLQGMVDRAIGQAGGRVASMFGGRGMGGSSMEQQLAARELGGIAADMYGRAYEGERGRQTAMQSALGSLETGRLGLGLQQRGQNIGAATTLGQLFGQERGLQQEAAFNVPALTTSDLARLQAGVGAATGLEGYGTRQREEARQAWMADQMAPYNRLGFIGSTSAGQPWGRTTTTSGQDLNPITSALGGAMAGYGLYRMGGFGNPSPPPSPYQTGVPSVPGYPGYGPGGPSRGGWV